MDGQPCLLLRKRLPSLLACGLFGAVGKNGLDRSTHTSYLHLHGMPAALSIVSAVLQGRATRLNSHLSTSLSDGREHAENHHSRLENGRRMKWAAMHIYAWQD